MSLAYQARNMQNEAIFISILWGNKDVDHLSLVGVAYPLQELRLKKFLFIKVFSIIVIVYPNDSVVFIACYS